MQLRSSFLSILFSLSAMTFLGGTIADDRGVQGIEKTTDDTDQIFTTVGNIGLTVTNYGTIGNRNAYFRERRPSCEYPRGSRIEHLYQGGLWVGAISRSSGQTLVSTGAHDRLFTGTPQIRPEFASDAGAGVLERSSLQESRFFDENAVSHQDFVSWFTDSYRRNPTTGDTIPDHNPLNITVRQESYAWNFPFAEFFVILNYTIYNTGVDTLDSVYVGFWNNGVVRNTNTDFVPPGTTGYFDHGANGYMDSLRLMYTFDFDGIPGARPADSYVGIKLLGMNPFPIGSRFLDSIQSQVHFNAWRFRSSSGVTQYFSPTEDGGTGLASRYDRLRFSLQNDPPPNDYISQLRTRADNTTTMLSAGVFPTLRPGDSLNVVFGVVCARKFGTDAARFDTPTQRKTLLNNVGLCQQAYDGEDVNGNNILDPGEDLNGNGKLDHYQLPQPPRSPKVHVEVGNQTAAIYWDKSTSELSLDPITHALDFEGYRVYRSNAGADFTSPEDLLLTLSLVGEFDNPNNTFGYNTGFSQILLPQPKFFPPDTVAYWYRFPPPGSNVPHLNGWQYLYGIAAFDRGDSASGIASLQSKTEILRIVAGTPATSDANKQVGVYPNPYYVNAVWDGSGERNRKVYFYNLPNHCEIRIYTLAGDVVADMLHDGSTYDGSNTAWFQRFGNSGSKAQFAGGEHAWDLITKFDQAIASGLYLFSVKDSDTGDIKTGKFVVIK